jgi:general stress protein 26
MEGSHNTGEDFAHLKELIEDTRIAMMTTRDDDGTLRSRPLQTLRCADEGTLWFFTSASSPKVAEAASDGWQVNLSYANPDKQDYVSISGRATLSRDKKLMEAMWSKWVEVFFPKGIDDPDLALLRVDIEKAEYWDSPGTAIGRAYALGKALVTGKKDAIGDNVKLNT